MGEYAMGVCGAGVKRFGLATRNDIRLANECVSREGRKGSNQRSARGGELGVGLILT